MQGRSEFTRRELAELRSLIRNKQIADRTRQKALRARMRAIRFYISDFGDYHGGFTVSDLDDLLERRAITVIGEDASSRPAQPRPSSPPARPLRRSPRRQAAPPVAATRRSSATSAEVASALDDLDG